MVMYHLSNMLATGFYLGYVPLMPGTLASALIAAILWHVPTSRVLMAPGMLVVLTLVGVITSWVVERCDGRRDPARIVIDEVVGMALTLNFVPVTAGWYIFAFCLFRFFDIVKPLFIDAAQRLPGGLGVMLDDVLAGFFAGGMCMLITWGM